MQRTGRYLYCTVRNVHVSKQVLEFLQLYKLSKERSATGASSPKFKSPFSNAQYLASLSALLKLIGMSDSVLSFRPGFCFHLFQRVLEQCQVITCLPHASHFGSPATQWPRSWLHTGFQGHRWSRSAGSGVIPGDDGNQVLRSTLEGGDGAGPERGAAALLGRGAPSHRRVVKSTFRWGPWNRRLQSPTVERDFNVGRSTRTYIFEKQLGFCSSLKNPSMMWPSECFDRRVHRQTAAGAASAPCPRGDWFPKAFFFICFSMLYISETSGLAWLCQDCCNKVPYIQWLKKQKCIIS